MPRRISVSMHRCRAPYEEPRSGVLLGAKRQTQGLPAVPHRDLSGKPSWGARRRHLDFSSEQGPKRQ